MTGLGLEVVIKIKENFYRGVSSTTFLLAAAGAAPAVVVVLAVVAAASVAGAPSSVNRKD